jgi:hypothetical protein
MVTWAMTIARTNTEMLVVSAPAPVDPVMWKISATTATNAAMIVCLEKNRAIVAPRPPSARMSTALAIPPCIGQSYRKRHRYATDRHRNRARRSLAGA